MTKDELIDKLASSIGLEKATATVAQACTDLRFGAPGSGDLTHVQMLALLDRLTEDTGLVGTVARFVKVRVILAGPAPQGLGITRPTGANPVVVKK